MLYRLNLEVLEVNKMDREDLMFVGESIGFTLCIIMFMYGFIFLAKIFG